ncbi:MAG TPA: DUF1835 domain-containing protein [Candidatus Agathobaculum intestinigallinarum]|nr:DUF1835 domain-containing protein [Candidatus Agathobaculum intestinigallinarum]
MYWICFGDSAKGTLRHARHDFAPEVAYDHILALYDDYAEGDIADVTDRAAREAILMPWRGDPELDGSWMDELTERHFETLTRLDEIDEAVIWYSKGNALEQCGLRYVVSRLYARHIPVWVTEVNTMPSSEIKRINDQTRARRNTAAVGVITDSRPLNFLLRFAPQALLQRYTARVEQRLQKERMTDGIAYFSTVGEVAPNLMLYFYQRRRLLTETEQAQLLSDWKRLREENAPLRAMMDGRVQSVSADFYDEAILSGIAEAEMPAALAVGRAIGELGRKTGNRVGDMFVFSRIRALAQAGKIEIVQDAPTYRDMTIRKIGS